MLSLNSCIEIINKEFNLLKTETNQPAELYNPIYYVLDLAGKRIRPTLTLMACHLFSEDISVAIKPAAAIEIFHNFTLVHDDMMDNAILRRNQPTIHAKWDYNVAILSGDAMMIKAYQLMCDVDQELIKPLLDIFNKTALAVCEGQQYDMNFATRNDVHLDEYIQMIALKTSVLLAASLKIGAICGYAPEQEAEKLYQFGLNLGLAFQIQDDYLDVYANQDVFGKMVGGDIAENKKTFLLIKALELAKEEHSVILQKAINNEIPDMLEKVRLVRKVYDELNIAQVTKDKITEYSNKAFEFLQSVDIEDTRKMQLLELAYGLMKRKK
jgi:geranylgeranyl diphosphate synthase, type II